MISCNSGNSFTKDFQALFLAVKYGYIGEVGPFFKARIPEQPKTGFIVRKNESQQCFNIESGRPLQTICEDLLT